jgi:hypothetical protein
MSEKSLFLPLSSFPPSYLPAISFFLLAFFISSFYFLKCFLVILPILAKFSSFTLKNILGRSHKENILAILGLHSIRHGGLFIRFLLNSSEQHILIYGR